MRLEMDIGNTRIKWRLVEGEITHPSCAQTVDELRLPFEPVKEVWISSVADKAVNDQVNDLMRERYDVVPQYARVDVNSSSILCAYEHPERLGVDRWLALLAARDQCEGALIVVDVGSAVTIDLMMENQHCGGFIMPGYSMLQTTLLGQTARIKFEGLSTSVSPTGGRDTASCVSAGADLMFEGLAQSILSLKDRFDQSAQIVLTGGDAHRLESMLGPKDHPVLIADLVLEGLKLNERGLV